MSLGDWLLVVLGLPLVICVGAWASHRVWVQAKDASAGVAWLTGESGRPGYEVALLPFTLSTLLLWLTLLSAPAWEQPHTPSILSIVFFVACVMAMVSGLVLQFFMWPKFAVPPHLRGESGWFVVAWRARRTRGPRKEGRRKRS